MILSGGVLYGTTQPTGSNGGGTVFSVPAGYGTPQTLATFNATTGNYPSSLVLSGGMLYGTTGTGGAYGDDNLFSVPVTGGNLTTLVSFNNGTDGGGCGPLILSGGNLYGAAGGGANGYGTVISFPVGGGNITTLATFNGTNGIYPASNLILSGSNLYGITNCGGNLALNNGYGFGAVFSVPITGGNITTVATFNGAGGTYPEGNIVVDSSGNLYGMATGGGATGNGTVWSVPITGGNITALVSFSSNTGMHDFGEPAGLCIDASGNLYGVTEFGGAYNEGTLFELVAPVPEPAGLALLAVGSIGLLARRRRR